jgi:hypothetical protein
MKGDVPRWVEALFIPFALFVTACFAVLEGAAVVEERIRR